VRRFLTIVLLGVALAGCESKSNPKPPEAVPSPVADKTVGQLTDTVGDPDTVQKSAMLSRDMALAAADDYGPRTGKWFEGENGFSLITSISAGEQQAGGEAGVGIGKVPEGRSVRFQITSRDPNGKRKELLKEYAADITNAVNGRLDFSYKMPEQPNVNYLLSVEILSSENAVEDTLISPLFVPAHELNARLEVEQPAAGSEQTKLKLYNAGPTELFFGYGYAIFRKEPDGWMPIPDSRAVPSIGIHVKPGESFEENVEFQRKPEPGEYRLVKQFDGYMTDLKARLAADFEIR
jgi:hypothetical protein